MFTTNVVGANEEQQQEEDQEEEKEEEQQAKAMVNTAKFACATVAATQPCPLPLPWHTGSCPMCVCVCVCGGVAGFTLGSTAPACCRLLLRCALLFSNVLSCTL